MRPRAHPATSATARVDAGQGATTFTIRLPVPPQAAARAEAGAA